MFIIASPIKKELEIDKSRFIALVYPLTNLDEIKDLIKSAKETYPKARHYLYAYQFDKVNKSNDDGEPGAIAKGFHSLAKNYDLTNYLIIVVRYFGGVKLGASRLLRTYLNVTNEALKDAMKKELKLVYRYQLKCDYATFNKLKKLGYQVANVQYHATISLEIISLTDIYDVLVRFKVSDLVKEKVIRAL